MLGYLEDERIRAQWLLEEKADSHYGLTLAAIRVGVEEISSDASSEWDQAA